jgi:ribosomal protein L37AE/L43A
MPDQTPPRAPVRPITPLRTTAAPADDKTLCERCGAEMYRMHAVWRCSACGYKTDCCGW